MPEEETQLNKCKHCGEPIIKFPDYDWLHMYPSEDDYSRVVTIRTRKNCTAAVATPVD